MSVHHGGKVGKAAKTRNNKTSMLFNVKQFYKGYIAIGFNRQLNNPH